MRWYEMKAQGSPLAVPEQQKTESPQAVPREMTNIHTFVCMYVCTYVCKWVAREHHFLVNLKNLSNELFVACPHWKENMRPSSRDYSINTATLDPTKPKTWLLRAVLAIHALLLRPLRDPKDAAQCFRDKVMNLGPFIAQHVIWAFQLLGIVFVAAAASPKKHQLKRTKTKMLRLLNFSGSEH